MDHHFPVKKKLELLRQIRSRYQRDKSDMYQRERILYGRTSAARDEYAGDVEYYEADATPKFSTFSLRFFLAVAAAALLILTDRTGRDFFGLTAEQCFQAISTDYESSIAAWADAASRAIVSEKKGESRPLKDNPPSGARP